MKELNEVVCEDGGVMKECWKDDGGWQLNLRTIPPGVTAGGHAHMETNELFWFLSGRFQVHLKHPDGKEERFTPPTKSVLKIEPGVYHRVTNAGALPAAFAFWMDREYDPEDYVEWK